MWGGSILGFGTYHYKYASGHEGDAPLIGLSPRKGKISIYHGCELGLYKKQTDQLGKCKIGKGCLYIQKLSDVNTEVLNDLFKAVLKK